MTDGPPVADSVRCPSCGYQPPLVGELKNQTMYSLVPPTDLTYDCAGCGVRLREYDLRTMLATSEGPYTIGVAP
ncbi:MAG: hypothetical protein V4510_13155 [bacterium]